MRRSGLKEANPIARPLVTRDVPSATAASAPGFGGGLGHRILVAQNASLQGGAHYGAHHTCRRGRVVGHNVALLH